MCYYVCVNITLEYKILPCYKFNLSKVFSAFCHQVAIKSIRKEKIKDEQDMVHIRREIEIMSSLRHPHIISIYEGEGLLHVETHIHAWQHTHKQNHKRPKSTSPSAHSALVANLQNCHVMTRRCHNKTWSSSGMLFISSLSGCVGL